MQETQETWVRSLGQEDPQKEMAIYCSILAWKIAWIEETGWPQTKGSQRVGHGRVDKHNTGSTLYNICARMCVLSCFNHVWLLVTPRTVACQAPLSMRFSRQEYWSVLPCPPLGDLPDPAIESAPLMSPTLAGSFFTTEPPGVS